MGVMCCRDKKPLEENIPRENTRIITDSNLKEVQIKQINSESSLKDNKGKFVKGELEYLEQSPILDSPMRDIFKEEDCFLEPNDPFNRSSQFFYEHIRTHFYLRTYIDYLEVFYKSCDDFGLIFKPYIELKVSNIEPVKISNNDEEKTEKLNGTNGTNEDSFNSEISDNRVSKSSVVLNQGSLKEGKVYPFKTSKNFELLRDQFYNTLIISVKNENQSLVSESPPVTIAECRIPINMIVTTCVDNVFDGMVEMKIRNTTFVGNIKVILAVTHQNLEGHVDLLKRMASKRTNGEVEGDTTIQLSLLQKQNIWDNSRIMHYMELDPEVLDYYFLFDIEKREAQINSADSFYHQIYKIIPNSNSSPEEVKPDYFVANVNSTILNSKYAEAIKVNDENFVLLYEVLVCLVKLANEWQFNIINDFLKNLNDDEMNVFKNIPKFTDYNMHLLKVLLIFLYKYQKFFKSIKSISVRNQKYIEDSTLMTINLNLIKKIQEYCSTNRNKTNEELLILNRDSLVWTLNNLNETISLPSDLINTNKNEVNEQSKKDYNLMYDNCMNLISHRVSLLKILDFFLNDSQVVGGVVRLFRKIIQVLTNDTNNLIDKSREPRIFAIEFRKLIVSQNDGFFITTLRAILLKFAHYPEIHNNILIILYQITNYLDRANLLLTAENLDLDEFKTNFDPYRTKLRSFCRFLNNLHLNILANLSAIAKTNSENQTEQEGLLQKIMFDLKAYYRYSSNSKKRLEDFKTRKFYEVETHEVITRIAVNITKYPNLAFSLLESYFYDDLIEYLIIISQTRSETKDFIQEVCQKKKKDSEEIKKYVLSIVENSQQIFLNIMDYEDVADQFCNNKLTDHQVEDAIQFVNLFEECKKVLSKYDCSFTKFDKNLENLKSMFDYEKVESES